MPPPTRSPLSDRLMTPLRRLAAAEMPPRTDALLLTAFVSHRDPVAFDALVRRHGPMVLGVCRRVIGHAPDADDAFQAVFVVLARRAASVKPAERVADFLFGVAYRTALKVRATLARRRTRETPMQAATEPAAPPPDVWADVQPIIDQELAALPDKLRLPVLLCDLQGRTQRDAATLLKLPPATLATRLVTARRLLAARLTARGVTLAGGALAAILTANAAKAVPTTLAGAASGAALAAVGLGSGVVSANVLKLSEGVLTMIATKKLKVLAGLVLACGLLAGGGMNLVNAADPPAPKAKIGPTLDDRAFLTKTCEALRGTAPTPAEMSYFLADKDDGKRKKVVGWLTEPEAVAVAEFDARWFLSFNTRKEQQDGMLYRRLALDSSTGTVRTWDLNTRETLVLADPKLDPPAKDEIGTFLLLENMQYSTRINNLSETDEAFLARVIESARRGKPTRVESEYFRADKDAKKREKLLDALLTDVAFAKKVGPEWKKTMLATPLQETLLYGVFDVGGNWADKLIDDLTAKKKTDEQILEALTLAAAGRLPTDIEKKLVTTQTGQAKDKTAAWRQVAGTLAGTDEAKAHADRLKPQAGMQYRGARVGPMIMEVKPAETKKCPDQSRRSAERVSAECTPLSPRAVRSNRSRRERSTFSGCSAPDRPPSSRVRAGRPPAGGRAARGGRTRRPRARRPGRAAANSSGSPSPPAPATQPILIAIAGRMPPTETGCRTRIARAPVE